MYTQISVGLAVVRVDIPGLCLHTAGIAGKHSIWGHGPNRLLVGNLATKACADVTCKKCSLVIGFQFIKLVFRQICRMYSMGRLVILTVCQGREKEN